MARECARTCTVTRGGSSNRWASRRPVGHTACRYGSTSIRSDISTRGGTRCTNIRNSSRGHRRLVCRCGEIHLCAVGRARCVGRISTDIVLSRGRQPAQLARECARTCTVTCGGSSDRWASRRPVGHTTRRYSTTTIRGHISTRRGTRCTNTRNRSRGHRRLVYCCGESHLCTVSGAHGVGRISTDIVLRASRQPAQLAGECARTRTATRDGSSDRWASRRPISHTARSYRSTSFRGYISTGRETVAGDFTNQSRSDCWNDPDDRIPKATD